jgi:DNA-binding response OmpR family regulator
MAATKTLLIVEDDATTREEIADFLHQAGYKVTWAFSGAEALAFLDTLRPDLILLDTLSPAVDERHFLRQVKAKRLPPVPIIDVSAAILPRRWAVDHDFIHRPIDLDAVLKEVQHCLEE